MLPAQTKREQATLAIFVNFLPNRLLISRTQKLIVENPMIAKGMAFKLLMIMQANYLSDQNWPKAELNLLHFKDRKQ